MLIMQLPLPPVRLDFLCNHDKRVILYLLSAISHLDHDTELNCLYTLNSEEYTIVFYFMGPSFVMFNCNIFDWSLIFTAQRNSTVTLTDTGSLTFASLFLSSY